MIFCTNGTPAMKEEVSAAVLFLTRFIGKNEALTQKQIETFRTCLYGLLTEHFKDHWFPEKPSKGQAYRCIRINETERRDPILEEAAKKCGLKYNDLHLPVELTLWVDPDEVCCRFGEHKGSYCTVASFKNGNKENFVQKIDIHELELRAAEILKKATLELQRKKKLMKMNGSPRKHNRNCNIIATQNNILQQLPTLSPVQNFHSPLFLMPPAPSYQQQLHFPNMASTPPQRPYFPRPLFPNKNINNQHPQFFRPFGNQNNTLMNANFVRQSPGSKRDRFHWINYNGNGSKS